LCHVLFFSTKNFAHAQTLYRMSSLCRSYECMNIAPINIGVLTGWKKIKQRRISFVLGYLRMILWKISTVISIRCIFIMTPFRLNWRSCLLSESENPTYRSYVLTTCNSNWLIWKQKVCKTFLSSSRNISIIIVTQNSLKRVSWPIFWTKYVTL
jgi:hypothetical protein